MNLNTSSNAVSVACTRWPNADELTQAVSTAWRPAWPQYSSLVGLGTSAAVGIELLCDGTTGKVDALTVLLQLDGNPSVDHLRQPFEQESFMFDARGFVAHREEQASAYLVERDGGWDIETKYFRPTYGNQYRDLLLENGPLHVLNPLFRKDTLRLLGVRSMAGLGVVAMAKSRTPDNDATLRWLRQAGFSEQPADAGLYSKDAVFVEPLGGTVYAYAGGLPPERGDYPSLPRPA